MFISLTYNKDKLFSPNLYIITKNIINNFKKILNFGIGLAVLFATVWVVSKGWTAGQKA